MALAFLKHTWQKITLTILLLLFLIILVLGWFFDEHWSPMLEKQLHAEILKSSGGLYNANFSSAEFHLLQGKIVIFDLSLTPDTAVYQRKIKEGYAPNNLLELKLKRLVLLHVHPFKLYFNHLLDIDQVIVSVPQLHLSYRLNHTKDSTLADNRTAWQRIAKSLHSVQIHDIVINDIQFKYDDHSGNQLEISELKEMNIHASDLLIDSVTQTDRSRLLYCKDVIAELNNYSGKTADGLYSYRVKYLKLSSKQSRLNAEDVSLEPVNENLFFKKTTRDRYSVHAASVQLNKFDFLNYHKYRSFSVSHIIVDQGTFSLFSNPNNVSNNPDKSKSFPQFALSSLKMDMKVDTVSITRLNVNYSEINSKSKKAGTISFNNTTAHFFNITNNKAALQKNHIATAKLSSYLMGRGELNARFTFNLTDKNFAYAYKGNIGPMNLRLINPAAMPLGMVKVNAGELKKFDFDFSANTKIARGKVTLLYNDLKVTVLKADTADDKLQHNTIASLYANIFIIKHNNPDVDGGIPRSFNVSFVRPVTSPFFNYTWRSLLTGIKPNVGFDQHKQDATKAMVAQSVVNKQNRITKKAERLARRAQRKQKREERKLLKSLNSDDDAL